MKRLFVLLIILLLCCNLVCDTTTALSFRENKDSLSSPKSESSLSSTEKMEGIWIATVNRMDYPKKKNDIAAQKKEFIHNLDQLKKIGINTVIVQVRPTADAFYNSKINPWSKLLTGTQGKYPGYDPMEFMITQTHKRGMKFQAWLNPYRITVSGTNLKSLSKNHPARLHPTWCIRYNNALYYNPASPAVKKHVIATVGEIVTNYNVDGIVFDDYFYPSNYPLPKGEGLNGKTANKRRKHINDMVKGVSKKIKSINKNVVFGISPSGIWRNKSTCKTGSNTQGSQSYYAVCADTRTWIKNEWIDYVSPQIYWETGYKIADYETLVKWWSHEVKGTNVKLYIGQGIYRKSVAKEITKQLKINKKYSAVSGSIYFNQTNLLKSNGGCKKKIQTFIQNNPIN